MLLNVDDVQQDSFSKERSTRRSFCLSGVFVDANNGNEDQRGCFLEDDVLQQRYSTRIKFNEDSIHRG